MRAYSVDLRQRIVEAVKDKAMTKLAVAELYGVSRATVYRYLSLDQAGDLAPKTHPGPPPRLDKKARDNLLKQLRENDDLSLEEHALKFSADNGIELRKSSIANYFNRLGVRRKKDALSERAR